MGRGFWVALHRYLGLAMMALLFTVALTGSLIAFEHEIDAWLNPELLRTGHARPALPPDALIEGVERADPRLRVSFIPLDAKPGEALELRVTQRTDPASGQPFALSFDRLLLDPTSGELLGRRRWGALQFDRAHLMSMIDLLHRKLQLPDPWGKWLTGGLALAWLIASLIGAWLTLPRSRKVALPGTGARLAEFWRRWKPAWQIKRRAAWQRTSFDLHRAVALWSLPAALLLALSGVYFSLGQEVFRPVVSLFGPLSPSPARTLPRSPAPEREPAFGVQDALAQARTHLPPGAQGFLPWFVMHLPRQGVYRVAFKEEGMREQALRLRYQQVYIDDQSGAPKGLDGYESGTTADRFLIWQYPLHTGKVLGLWGRVLVCALGLLIASLCVTGLLVWWSRRRAILRVR